MWMPSHTLHIDGVPRRNMRQPDTGAFRHGLDRAVDRGEVSWGGPCRPALRARAGRRPTMSGIVPAMNHACAAPSFMAATYHTYVHVCLHAMTSSAPRAGTTGVQPRLSEAPARAARCSSRPRGASPATATATWCSNRWRARRATRAAPCTTSSRTRRISPWRWSSGSTRPGGARSVRWPSDEPDPAAALIALARGHAVFCRRDIARVMMALRVEFSGQDHPVGREIERISKR